MSNVLEELFEAIKRGCHREVATLLTTCGDKVNSIFRQHTTITWALAHKADDDIVQLILAHAEFDPWVKNQSGRTGLWEAARDGRANLVRDLLYLGAPIDEPDMHGLSPLGACTWNNSHEAARILLEFGADVNSRDRNGDTPLHAACASGAHDIVDLLLAHRNCDFNSRNNALQTPLMVALPSAYNIQVRHQTVSQSLSICRRLLEAGCDECARDKNHQTALHDRIRQNDLTGVCLLLDHNPHLANIPDNQGNTPMTLALESGWSNMELARCLLFYGALPSCLLSAISQKANGRAAKMMSDQPFRQGGHGIPPDQYKGLYHKLRFWETFLASIFVTKETVSVLLGDDFLSDILNDRNAPEAVSESHEGQSSSDASSTNPSVECRSSAARGPDTMVTGELRENPSVGSTTASSCCRCLGEATRYVRWSLQHSMSLLHQSRLAVRRALGTSLTVGLHTLGLPEKLQHYLTLGIHPMRQNPYKAAMLHVAVVEGDVATVRRLLQEGVDPKVPFMESSPLTRAVEMGPDYSEPHGEADRKRHAPVGQSAATPTHHQQISGMITTGSGGLCGHGVAAPNSLGDASDGSDEVIELLLRHGASWADRDPQGDTPVHVAVTRDQWLVHKLTSPSRLLKGSEETFVEAIRVKDSCGLTPLQNAVLARHWPSARALLQVLVEGLCLGSCVAPVDDLPVQNPSEQSALKLGDKIKADAEDTYITLLHCAAAAGAARQVKVLLTLGAKVNAMDKLGNTPLHAAACKGKVYCRENYCPGLTINHRPLAVLRCWPARRLQSSSCQICGSTSQLQESSLGGFGFEDESANLSDEEQAGGSKDWFLSTKVTAGDAEQVEDGALNRSQPHQNFLHIPEVSYRATIQVLLSHGADVTRPNSWGLDAKRLAAKYSVDFNRCIHHDTQEIQPHSTDS